jgi:hypothetical protein
MPFSSKAGTPDVLTMLTTHDSMRIHAPLHEGFALWRAIEVTGDEPLFVLTVEVTSDRQHLSLMFCLDHDLTGFLAEQTSVKPIALEVLVPRNKTGQIACRLLRVARLQVLLRTDPLDRVAVLTLASGQTVRASDLAPFDTTPATEALSIYFPQTARA